MATRHIDVKRLREHMGLSQSQLVRRVWGTYKPYYKRTVRRWENDATSPSPMAQKHLEQLWDEHTQKQASDGGAPASPEGPKRKHPKSKRVPGEAAGSTDTNTSPAPARLAGLGILPSSR